MLKRIRQTTDDELPEGVQGFDREQLSVIYVDSVDGEVLLRRIEVDAQGEFVDRWPRGFFAERMEELL